MQSTLQETPATKYEKICDILERHARHPSRLIPILQAVQEEYRYLPEEVLTYVATALDITPARVFGVATFYAHFAMAPKGKHVVRLCDGTACHVKRSLPILNALRDRLGVDEKHKTTADLLFTVETVACLGACGLAPVMVVDEEVHGLMSRKRPWPSSMKSPPGRPHARLSEPTARHRLRRYRLRRQRRLEGL